MASTSNINATHFENISTFPDPEKQKYLVNAIIETARNTRHKYAFDPQYGIFTLKTTISEGLEWPYDYGFVPQTLGEDGDPVDILFLDDEPTFTGCLVQCRLIGIIRLEKNGEENDRLLACAQRCDGVAQRTDQFDDIDDVPKELIQNITTFLVDYSSNEKNEITFKGVDSRKKALRAIEDGMKLWKKQRKKGKK